MISNDYTPEQIQGAIAASRAQGFSDADITKGALANFGVDISSYLTTPVAAAAAPAFDQAAQDRLTAQFAPANALAAQQQANTYDPNKTVGGLTLEQRFAPANALAAQEQADASKRQQQAKEDAASAALAAKNAPAYQAQLDAAATAAATAAAAPVTGALTQAAATAAATAAAAPSGIKITDIWGGVYDSGPIMALAAQLGAIADPSKMQGGVYGTSGDDVRFSTAETTKLLGRPANIFEQILLDSARDLISQGITDISQITAKPVYNTRTEYTGHENDQAYEVEDPTLGLSGSTAIQSFQAGRTYAGEGGTGYQVNTDPVTGKQTFTTFGINTSDKGAINALLSIASFVPGVAPFAQAAKAAMAIESGDILGGLASLANLGGFSDAATALNVGRAVQSGNAGALVSALLNNPTLSASVGGIDLGNGITIADAGNAFNVASNISSGNLAGALSAAGSLTGSSDLQTAGAAAGVITAINSGNMSSVVNAVSGLASTIQAANNVLDPNLAKTITSSVAASTGGADTGFTAYQAAISAGATADEALAASNAVTGVFSSTSTSPVTTSTATGTPLGTLGADTTADSTGDRVSVTGGVADAVSTAKPGESLMASTAATTGTAGTGTATGLQYATFPEAYAAARRDLGAGKTFEWTDPTTGVTKSFSTSTAAEAPGLSGAISGIPGGTGATLKAVDQAAATQAELLQNAVNNVTGGVGQGQAGDTKASSIYGGANSVVGAVIVDAASQLSTSFTGVLKAAGVVDRGGSWDKAVSSFSDYATSLQPDDVRTQTAAFAAQLKAAPTAAAAALIVANAPLTYPEMVAFNISSEILQELPTLGIAGAVFKTAQLAGAAAKLAAKYGIGTSAVLDMMESGGSAGDETYKRSIAAGKTPEEAQADAQKSLLFASATTGVLSVIPGGNSVAKQIFSDAKAGSGLGKTFIAAGKVTAKSGAEEFLEEGTIEGITQTVVNPSADLKWKDIASNASWGALIGSGASGSISLGDSAVSAIADAGVSAQQAATLSGVVTNAASTAATSQEAGNNIVAALQSSGLPAYQATDIANSTVGNQILAASGNTTFDGSQVVGVDEYGGNVTLSELIGSSQTGLTGNGSVEIDQSTVIGQDSKGADVTLGQQLAAGTAGTGASTAGTGVANSVSSSIAAGVDASTAVSSSVAAAITAGVDASTAVSSSVAAAITAGVGVDLAVSTAVAAAVTAGADVSAALTAATTAVTTAADTTGTVTADTTGNVDTNPNVNLNADTNPNVDPNVNTDPAIVSVISIAADPDVDPATKIDEILAVDPTATVIDADTVIVDGEAIDVTTGEVLTAEEVAARKAAAAKIKTNVAKRAAAGPSGGTTPVAAATTYTPADPKETWLGGRSLAPLAAASFAPGTTQESLDEQAFSALRQASGVEPGGRIEPTLGTGRLSRIGERAEPKLTGDTMPDSDFYAYGKEPSFESIMRPFMGGGTVQEYANGGKIMASPLMAAAGGDVPHKGSHYVQGAGGGQDDLISAKLADGEYVFDAEIVAALGDGSNREGARKLDAMREAIRKHKRAGSLKSIPPKAKSPLAYLKGMQ